MRKLWEIIKREYLTRVRKKTFLLMTVLGPLLFAGIFVAPFLLSSIGSEQKVVAVKDESALFEASFPTTEKFVFTPHPADLASAKTLLDSGDYDAVLHIPPMDIKKKKFKTTLYSTQSFSITALRSIRSKIEERIKDLKLKRSGLDPEFIAELNPEVDIQTLNIKEGKEKTTNTAVTSIMGLAGALLIYLFIFLYGAQVMRGVIEEKTNRIVEVVISSVKPFQLMMGKIVGLAAVGLTQFFLWVILTLLITAGVTSFLGVDQVMKSQQERSQMVPMSEEAQGPAVNEQSVEIYQALADMNLWKWGATFIFYFLGGYILYSSLFAAIGSLADMDTDTQQFMLPVSTPLILGIIISQVSLEDPSGPLAVWGSIIPFTSPVVMMVRIPFGVPAWQYILSMALLIGTFIGITAFAGRIYRMGVLMYGKKFTYKDLMRWIRYGS